MAKLHIKLLFSLIIVAIPQISTGQINKIIREKATKALNNPIIRERAKAKIQDELIDLRSEYDSSSFNYAIALSDNAGMFESKEQFERQQRMMIEYFERKQGVLSEKDQARAMVDRSEIMFANGKYKVAAGLLIGAKAIYEEEGMTRSIEYARTISNISLVAHSAGRLVYAEKFGRESLELRKDLLGEDSKGYAASLNNMALIRKDQGFYNESEALLTEALDKNKKNVGEESMGYAIVLNNMATLSQTLGRYSEAENLYKQSLKIAETHLKEKSGNFQRLQTNLALLYQYMGRYDESEKLYLEAIEIRKRRMSDKHPDYAHLLTNLAALYVKMEKYDQVEELLKTAIQIYVNKLGENSPATAQAKSDLGNFYLFRNENMKALALLRQSAEVRKNMLGPKHPETIQSAEDLAVALWQTGDIERSKQLFNVVIASTYNQMDEYFIPMSENEKAEYWATLRPRLNKYYTFVSENHQAHPELIEQYITLQTSVKGLLLNSSNKIKRSIMDSNDEDLKDHYQLWLDQKELLAAYYAYSKEDLASENINLDSLYTAANKTERYLSDNSPAFKEGFKVTRTESLEMSKNLKSGDALVDITQVKEFTNYWTGNTLYLITILKGNSEPPTLVVLDNGKELDQRYLKYYTNCIKNKLQDDYSYKMYVQPFESSLGQTNAIYLSPDGVYNQLNLNTLKAENGKYLIDRYSIVLLNNPADLLQIKSETNLLKIKKASLYGFPTYGGSGRVPSLPGTKVEITGITNLLKVKKYNTAVFLSEQATEKQIKEARPEGILHIATHGYFSPETKQTNDVFGIQAMTATENPMLRSGLMFSGAGIAIDGSRSQDYSGNNEGLLTAFEATNLVLDNTELVVLSACETAVGEVQSGEGVYGLQRSFLSAGAKSLIMSLWKVDDNATQQLMTAFYQQLLAGKTIDLAFREAQLQLRKKYSEPYFWGAFVIIRK